MFRALVTKVAQNGQQVLSGILPVRAGPKCRGIFKEGKKKVEGLITYQECLVRLPNYTRHGRKSWSIFNQYLERNVFHSLAARLRQKYSTPFQWRSMGNFRGMGNRLPLYAFVGFTFTVSRPDQQHQFINCETEEICRGIKHFFKDNFQKDNCMQIAGQDLEQFELGPCIAKGCNAVVYQARILPEYYPRGESQIEDDTSDNVSDVSSIESSTDDSSDVSSSSSLSHDSETDSDITVSTTDSNVTSSVTENDGSTLHVTNHDDVSVEDFVMLDFEADDVISLASSGLSTDDDVDDVSSSSTSESESTVSSDISTDGFDSSGDLTSIGNGRLGSAMQINTRYELAVKMMFNYDTRSDASSIWRAMRKELIPASSDAVSAETSIWENGNHVKKKLPPHPNIITILGAFVDEVPWMPDALSIYPSALPQRINPDGFGRNKTMFLVMPRYPYTLKDYLRSQQLTYRESLILITQLTEAVLHMTEHNVAHRDLKNNNILVNGEGSWPELVVTDFGCCLADDDLVVPYYSDDVTVGGNTCLMAPEIAVATPGRYNKLDYRKSDLWAVGTLAYEIFGRENPFYLSSKECILNSRTYNEGDLPVLSDSVPTYIRVLIRKILSRDPSQRPDVKSVANMLQILMWTPQEWQTSLPAKVTVMRWLLNLGAEVKMSERLGHRSSEVEYSLKRLFLSRLSFEDVFTSVKDLWQLNQS